jgi:hypothetical protein
VLRVYNSQYYSQSVSKRERDLAHEICAPVAMHGDLMIPAHFTHHPLRVPSPDKINLRLSARERLLAMHIYTRRAVLARVVLLFELFSGRPPAINIYPAYY